MVYHIMSESEEMYLVVIARANENGLKPVPLAQLALDLNVQPVSANQMIKKLEDAGKVHYTPYKGVELTTAGRREAARILRHRRLWEVFLAENLGFTPVEADEIACRLEHVVSDEVAERLSAFLGAPDASPQGKPIPASRQPASVTPDLDLPLASCVAGAHLLVASVKAGETERSFLRQVGIAPGAALRLLAIQAGGACLVEPFGQPLLQLAPSLAGLVRVRSA